MKLGVVQGYNKSKVYNNSLNFKDSNFRLYM